MVSTDQEIKHLLDRKIDEQVKQSDMVTEPAGQSAFDTQNDTWCVFVCPEIVKNRGVPDDAIKILLSSCRESTKKQY